MSLEVQGKITKILDKQTGTKKDGSGEWVNQSFLVETDAQYNNLYCFEVFGDEKVEKLNKYNKVGDSVSVEFNVSTNEWNGKYFTSLQAWKVMKSESNQTPDQPQEQAGQLNDDLPF